jgi:hypothetical protein
VISQGCPRDFASLQTIDRLISRNVHGLLDIILIVDGFAVTLKSVLAAPYIKHLKAIGSGALPQSAPDTVEQS